MAFSVFLRNPTCKSMLSQQLARLAPQPAPLRMASSLSNCPTIKFTNTTPILNAIRSFRTSPVRLSAMGHDHAKLWVVERVTSAALVPLIPLALAMPNKFLDSVVAILMVAHSFWGLEAIAVDYVRASVVGPVLPKVAIALVYLISIATLGGLFYLISHDVGIANSVRQLWAVRAEQKA